MKGEIVRKLTIVKAYFQEVTREPDRYSVKDQSSTLKYERGQKRRMKRWFLNTLLQLVLRWKRV